MKLALWPVSTSNTFIFQVFKWILIVFYFGWSVELYGNAKNRFVFQTIIPNPSIVLCSSKKMNVNFFFFFFLWALTVLAFWFMLVVEYLLLSFFHVGINFLVIWLRSILSIGQSLMWCGDHYPWYCSFGSQQTFGSFITYGWISGCASWFVCCLTSRSWNMIVLNL